MTADAIGKLTSGGADDLPPEQGTRYRLEAEEELRLEVPFVKQSTCTIILQKGSCELLGVELALQKPYVLYEGGFYLALFTWHGCVLDVDCETLEIAYTSDETICNVAFVNTHAQLEALRDQAVANGSRNAGNPRAGGTMPGDSTNNSGGPRVLIVGPTESGKTTLAQILTSYACKLGRSPMLVDLDPADNLLGVPGTIGACPMNLDAVTVDSFAAAVGIPPGTASPLLLWHGQLQPSADLFKAQVSKLSERINRRLQNDQLGSTSGVIVNTNGWIQDEGYKLLLHTIQAFQISVVLVLGHDRLYSMLKSATKNNADEAMADTKVIKLPRSGGVVSRETEFMRRWRHRRMKHYFYGNFVERKSAIGSAVGAASAAGNNAGSKSAPTTRVPQLTPFLLQLPVDQITIYKFSSMSLSASLLPVSAMQTTEAVQLTKVYEISDKLQHHILAVCHRQSVQAYETSGKAADLYLAGVAGFCAVERVVLDKIHLLSPCAGSLPSNTLLLGDITWME